MNRELWFLIAAQISQHTAMTGVRLVAPLLALRQGYSPLAVGFLLSLFALSQIFLALPAGRLADKYGFYRPVLFSVVLAMAGTVFAVIWPEFLTLCIAAFCTGGATGTIIIAQQRHAARMTVSTDALKKVFSWISLGPAISNFIGPFFAGVMIDLFGFRVTLVATFFLPLLSIFLARRIPQYTAPVPLPSAQKQPSAWSLLSSVKFRRLMMINWLLASCWDVHALVIPILGFERQLTATAIGSILGAFAVAVFAVRLVLPLLTARLHEWAVIMCSMIATSMVFCLYPFMPTAVSMGICSVFLGLSLGAVYPMVMSMLHQITPADRHGQAISLRLMAVNTSSVFMPALFGSVGATIGVASVFWVVAFAVGAGVRLAWKMKPSHEVPPVHHEPEA